MFVTNRLIWIYTIFRIYTATKNHAYVVFGLVDALKNFIIIIIFTKIYMSTVERVKHGLAK